MTDLEFDPSQLSETQQEALGTYTAVTNQEPSAAVPLLERSQWNVQVNDTVWIVMRSEADFHRLPLQNSSTVKLPIQSRKLELHSRRRQYRPHNHPAKKLS